MQLDNRGEYRYSFDDALPDDVYDALVKVDMMSDQSQNESQIAEQLYSKQPNVQHDSILGYYNGLYAGHVVEGNFRKNGSSGGLTSWILNELFLLGKIDGVIHAHAADIETEGVLFKYSISRDSESIQNGSKTRYYPMELSHVLALVKENPGRYAIVGIPEFITELRLLCKYDAQLKNAIKYMIGLICGHQKTAKYAEALAWEHGILPGNLRAVDFRVKQPNGTAYEYLQTFTGVKDGELITLTKGHNDLLVDHWPMGFFKSKFSDFTDNAFNETADIVLGDAWLDEYNQDGMGNNVVIVRNLEIMQIIKRGVQRGALKLDSIDRDMVKRSQSGLIHHIRDELPYRLFAESKSGWVPKKRLEPSNKIPKLRKKVQDIRKKSSIISHSTYQKAVSVGDWRVFQVKMERLLKKYDSLYERIHKEGVDGKSIREKLKIRTRIREAVRVLKRRSRLRTRVRNFFANLQYKWTWRNYRNSTGAIITLPGYYNYGNMVQRFASQEFLKQRGYNFVSYAKDLDVSDEDRERLRYTYDFVERNIWRKQYDPRDEFKTYIVGSDQVWRKWGCDDIFDELGYYFLDFAKDQNVKRIAYAASIGQDSLEAADYTEKFIPFAKELVQKFDFVGMREASGVELVKKEWDVDASLVLDPTLLLKAEDYNRLISAAPYEIKKVSLMFTYFILTDEPKRALIAKIAHDAELVDEGIYLESKEPLRPVEEWLAGIRDAKLVVIDSFHGMVFSIIYNTPFVVLESGTGGASRMTSLLTLLGIEDRYITSDKAQSFDVRTLKPINWDEVNAKLEVLRKKSADWLINAVESPKKP